MTRKTIFAVLALAAAPAAAQQPGVTADKILLGQAAVFTGPAAQLGIQMRNGIKSYVDFVNEKGGVHGPSSSWFPRTTSTSPRWRRPPARR